MFPDESSAASDELVPTVEEAVGPTSKGPQERASCFFFGDRLSLGAWLVSSELSTITAEPRSLDDAAHYGRELVNAPRSCWNVW